MTARKSTKEEKSENQEDYSKMTAVELKKLLDTRKIEGRSKLTKKENMIKVLELFDQDPEDTGSIASLVAELSATRKKNTSKSEVEEGKKSSEEEAAEEVAEEAEQEAVEETKEGEKEKPKRKTRSKKTKESTLEDKEKGEKTSEEEKSSEESEDSPISKKSKKSSKSRSSTDEDNPKRPSLSKKEREELLKKEGIDRSDYPKGTRFLFRGRKVQVAYPKNYKPSDSEENEKVNTEKEKSDSDSIEDIKESLTEKLTKMKKTSSVNIKVGKKEVQEPTPESREKEVEQEDPSMKEIYGLTRDILKRITYLEKEAQEDEKFKKCWIYTLNKLKEDLDHQLGMQGASIDE
jgi:hypothetical protein